MPEAQSGPSPDPTRENGPGSHLVFLELNHRSQEAISVQRSAISYCSATFSHRPSAVSGRRKTVTTEILRCAQNDNRGGERPA